MDQKIHDMLGRMAELAVMANDGTKCQVDRDNLQKEFDQMQKEISRITSGATASGKFNSLYLFRGESGVATMTGDSVVAGSVRLQVGPDSNQVFEEDELNLTATNFASHRVLHQLQLWLGQHDPARLRRRTKDREMGQHHLRCQSQHFNPVHCTGRR